jgi:hypothetical protein
MLKIKAATLNVFGSPQPVSLRCPVCRQQGTFDTFGGVPDLMMGSNGFQCLAGQRRCPNNTCLAHIFVVLDVQHKLIASYPPERFDFDTENLPGPILKTFEEATACHATGSYMAAAMMVRKTCELLCADRKAVGANLKERIRDLGKKIILPVDLLDAIDHLRLLGNDAAHLEATTYDDIGKDEVDIAFDLTKEILKATYQYKSLLGRLKSFQKAVDGGASPGGTAMPGAK